MSTLKALLKDVPVEWKALEEISDLYNGLTGKNKSDFEDGNAKFVTYKNIYGHIEVNPNVLESVKISPEEKQNEVTYGDILFTGSSENTSDVGVSCAVTIKPDFKLYLNSFSFGLRFKSNFKLIPEFSKYLFRSHVIREQIIKTASGVTRYNVSKKRFLKIQIPIPYPNDPEKSLAIQQEIVRVLDGLSEQNKALTTALAQEVEQRKKQYEHYREALFRFEGKEVEWKTLGEVSTYSKNRCNISQLNENNYVGVDNLLQNRAGKTTSKHLPTEGNFTSFNYGDILIGNIRPYLKKIWFATCEGGASGDVLVIQNINNKLSPKYLYQILADDRFFNYNMTHAKGAKMPRGDKSKIMEFKMPIPFPNDKNKSIQEQERIVHLLDQFDEATKSIVAQLEKEIELRNKQYEYYRNLLLSFPKGNN